MPKPTLQTHNETTARHTMDVDICFYLADN